MEEKTLKNEPSTPPTPHGTSCVNHTSPPFPFISTRAEFPEKFPSAKKSTHTDPKKQALK
jgi:hypothetical protein